MTITAPLFVRTLAAVSLIAALALAYPVGVQARPGDRAGEQDKTLSPYFFVKSDNPETDRLPLKSTRAAVKIAGVVADVTVTQVYKNEGRNTLEAVYVFPGSTRAAVYAMRMTIGKRVIEAEIMERQKARETYEQAKQEGRTASLLEQQRPNVFQMNVANILPGDEIKVELQYTELIEPEDQVYEFVYPAVVGPRYGGGPASSAGSDDWVKNPYLHEGEGAPYTFNLAVDLAAGLPISELSSPSTGIDVEYGGKSQAHISLKDARKAALKDFVLRYKLTGGRIQTGLLLYPGREENFFLMMMQPPARVPADKVVPREYIFIVDVSGSMNGFPLTEIAKPLMKRIISDLRPQDYVNVLLFAGGSAVLSTDGSLPATESNKRRAISFIESRRAGGGTEILPALKRALNLPRTKGVSRIVAVVTDGYVRVEPQVFKLVRQSLGQANLFAFGVGTSVNRHLIEGLARTGLGEPFVVLNRAEGKKMAEKFRLYVANPVLTDIAVNFQDFKAYDLEPAAVPDLFAQRPIVVMGKYRGRAAGRIAVSGRGTGGQFQKTMNLEQGHSSADNSALRLLWARQRIKTLSDLNMLRPQDDRIREVTDIGLKYSLMTRYTSFVAVDKVKRADGQLVTVKQPLPLPEGVTDMAVGQNGLGVVSYRKFKPAAPSSGFQETLKAPLPSVSEPAPAKEADVVKSEVRLRNGRELTLTIVELRGPRRRPEVTGALRSKMKLLGDCWREAKANGAAAPVEMIFRINIAADGRVTSIKLVNNTQGSRTLVDCLTGLLKKIRFKPQEAVSEVVLKVNGLK